MPAGWQRVDPERYCWRYRPINPFYYRATISRGRVVRVKVADKVSKVPALQRRRSEVLRGMRRAAGQDMCELRSPAFADREILPRVRTANQRVREPGVII